MERNFEWNQMLVYLFQPNDLALQGHLGPWVQERMPGFLASSNSKILSIPGGQQDIDLRLALYLGFLCSTLGPGETCHLPYACMICNTVNDLLYTLGTVPDVITHTLIWFPQLLCIAANCPHVQKRKLRLRGLSSMANMWHCYAVTQIFLTSMPVLISSMWWWAADVVAIDGALIISAIVTLGILCVLFTTIPPVASGES